MFLFHGKATSFQDGDDEWNSFYSLLLLSTTSLTSSQVTEAGESTKRKKYGGKNFKLLDLCFKNRGNPDTRNLTAYFTFILVLEKL